MSVPLTFAIFSLHIIVDVKKGIMLHLRVLPIYTAILSAGQTGLITYKAHTRT